MTRAELARIQNDAVDIGLANRQPIQPIKNEPDGVYQRNLDQSCQPLELPEPKEQLLAPLSLFWLSRSRDEGVGVQGLPVSQLQVVKLSVPI